MTTIIFAVEKPNTDASYDNEQKWKQVVTNLSILTSRNKDIQLLGENVLLISLDKTLDDLSKVIPQICGLPYKYLISTEEMKWTKVPMINP